MSRGRLAILVLAGVLALPVLASVPSTRPDTSSSPGIEAALSTCLHPTPADYRSLPQVHTPQRNPVPLTPEERSRLLFPHIPTLQNQSMGWAMRDSEYWRAIPAECRELPHNFDALPVLRFNNIEIRGERELRFRSHGKYDQWFLRDHTRGLEAVMAIQRETKRVYFFEYRQQDGKTIFVPGKESCYACHVSGPRLIRTYELAKVDRKRLEEFNQRLLSYGAADFGDAVDPKRLGTPLTDPRCVGCHDGKTRGRLYPIHMLTMAHYVETLKVMPPASPLPEDETRRLLAQVYGQRPNAKVARGPSKQARD